mmetsp:Transcript_80836/g.214594  ORF Transcript_80836/g.214594 Transcript_80836/m.214594 type:complete len:203 (+) Transcript_80836:857-1465(+)
MNAEADFSARCTSAASSPERPPAGASRRRFFGWPRRSAEASPSTLASKPLRRMKSSRERVACAIACSADHGSSLESMESRDSQESLSLLKIAPPPTVLSGADVWCFESTSSAALRFSMAWMLSTSLPWNSCCCFSRRAVASSSEFLFADTSSSSSLMLVLRPWLLAARPSIVDESSETLAPEVEMDSSFSYSFVLHQQASLS